MLRITAHDKPDSLTLQVEGTLAGAFVQELESCWRSTQRVSPDRSVEIDLTGVTYIDDSGKDLLATFYAQGATFVCAGCLMRSVVAGITDEN
jgi:anti-anti-sigma regulatory factor